MVRRKRKKKKKIVEWMECFHMRTLYSEISFVTCNIRYLNIYTEYLFSIPTVVSY